MNLESPVNTNRNLHIRFSAMEDSNVPDLRTARVICGALIASVLLFWLIALVISGAGQNPVVPAFPLDALTLTAAALVAAVAVLAGVLFFRTRAVGAVSSLPRRDAGPPSRESLSSVQTNLIIAWTLLEGMALTTGMFFMITGVANLLIITTVVLIIGFAITFPRAEWYGEVQRDSHVRL